MSKWISIREYLPGDGRPLQIWGVGERSTKHANLYGYYTSSTGEWHELFRGKITEVTHFAEMLGDPNENNNHE